jgi:hypothetical protein
MSKLAHKSIQSLFRSKQVFCMSFIRSHLPGEEKSPTELLVWTRLKGPFTRAIFAAILVFYWLIDTGIWTAALPIELSSQRGLVASLIQFKYTKYFRALKGLVSHQEFAGSNSCWRPFFGTNRLDWSGKCLQSVRHIFEPSFYNPCSFCVIFIRNVPNKVFLSLFVVFE